MLSLGGAFAGGAFAADGPAFSRSGRRPPRAQTARDTSCLTLVPQHLLLGPLRKLLKLESVRPRAARARRVNLKTPRRRSRRARRAPERKACHRAAPWTPPSWTLFPNKALSLARARARTRLHNRAFITESSDRDGAAEPEPQMPMPAPGAGTSSTKRATLSRATVPAMRELTKRETRAVCNSRCETRAALRVEVPRCLESGSAALP